MIYLITNKITNDRYIGMTSRSLEDRWYRHCKAAEYGVSSRFYNALRKYGKDNFDVDFLCEGLEAEEIQMIAQHNPEYNLTAGGHGGDTSASPNYKAAIARRDVSGNKNPNYGNRGELSPLYGRKKTSEQIENHRKGYKGKRIPVRVDGVDYESVIQAARSLGRSERYVRLHDELNEWRY